MIRYDHILWKQIILWKLFQHIVSYKSKEYTPRFFLLGLQCVLYVGRKSAVFYCTWWRYLFLKYDFKAQKIARIICHYLPCCPREGINPRELMPPFTILAARLFLSPPTSLCPQNKESRQRWALQNQSYCIQIKEWAIFIKQKKRLIHQSSSTVVIRWLLNK